jgi:hypothetical protein
MHGCVLCERTVSELYQNAIGRKVLGNLSSEKQIPQLLETKPNRPEKMEAWDGTWLRPRQVRYQAARPQP